METKTTFTTVLGTNKKVKKSRVWIEGKRLTDHGFTVGTHYTRTATPKSLRLDVDPNGPLKVTGKGEHPIIDITGKIVTERFDGDDVQVTFEKNRITIK